MKVGPISTKHLRSHYPENLQSHIGSTLKVLQKDSKEHTGGRNDSYSKFASMGKVQEKKLRYLSQNPTLEETSHFATFGPDAGNQDEANLNTQRGDSTVRTKKPDLSEKQS